MRRQRRSCGDRISRCEAPSPRESLSGGSTFHRSTARPAVESETQDLCSRPSASPQRRFHDCSRLVRAEWQRWQSARHDSGSSARSGRSRRPWMWSTSVAGRPQSHAQRIRREEPRPKPLPAHRAVERSVWSGCAVVLRHTLTDRHLTRRATAAADEDPASAGAGTHRCPGAHARPSELTGRRPAGAVEPGTRLLWSRPAASLSPRGMVAAWQGGSQRATAGWPSVPRVAGW
jgi:hypothetical protein